MSGLLQQVQGECKINNATDDTMSGQLYINLVHMYLCLGFQNWYGIVVVFQK